MTTNVVFFNGDWRGLQIEYYLWNKIDKNVDSIFKNISCEGPYQERREFKLSLPITIMLCRQRRKLMSALLKNGAEKNKNRNTFYVFHLPNRYTYLHTYKHDKYDTWHV